MIRELLLCSLLLGLALHAQAQSFDITQLNKYSGEVPAGGTKQSIKDTPCNKDTQIDFLFNASSKATCASASCTTSNLNQSSMVFFDIDGNTLLLYLTSVNVLTPADFTVVGGINPDATFVFTFADTNNKVVRVLVPFLYSGTANGDRSIYEISSSQADPYIQNLRPLGNNEFSLDIMNFLNRPDFNRFYHATNTQKTETVLLSTVTYRLAQSATFVTTTPAVTFTPNYALSGNKLCFASNSTSGLFQTHLRENWPLWGAMISLFLFWLFYLLSESETHGCFDTRFENNKWTCWSVYSFFHLAHVEFFSRLTRLSNLYFSLSFQAVVLAALYSTLGDDKLPFTNMEMVIWTAAIALAASLPLPFLLGGVFLRGIYNTTLEKFRVVKKTKGTMMNKAEQEAIFEAEIDKLEQRLYTYYYWYYILIFAGFVCFWVSAVYMMMQTQREYYYLHRIWLASLAVVFALDVLVLEPVLTAVLGNTGFYRLRGYYYNFELGQAYKEIEQ